MSEFQPFRPIHGEDCPICYPAPPLWKIALMMALVLAPAFILLAIKVLVS